MNKMWRGVKPLLYLFLLFALFSTAASATTTIELIPDSNTVLQGNTVNVQIRITSDDPITSAQVSLDYPSTLLSITDGPSQGTMFTFFDLPGNDILGWMSSGNLATPTDFATVEFTAGITQTGPATIDLFDVSVGDDNAQALSVGTTGTTINVVALDPPAESADVIVSIIPEMDSVCNGDKFNANIAIASDDPITSAQVSLDYPSTLLSITDGPSQGTMFTFFDLPGNDILGWMSSGNLATPTDFATVEFTADSTNTGPATLNLFDVSVGDDQAQALSVHVESASVNVVECLGPPTPDPEITEPADDATIEGTVVVTEVDNSGSTNVTYNLFEYYADTNGNCVADDGSSWVEIGNDTDAPWQVPWNTMSVSNGKYLIRATMGDTVNNLVGTDEICVTVNNPIPDNSIPLNPLWNYISFPGTLDNATPEHVLDGLSIDAVLHYNAQTGIWENAATFGDFEPRTAYAIRTSEQGEQTIVNLDYKIATPPALQLYEGWNSVGLVGNAPGEQMNNGEDAFAQIDGSYDMLVGPWNATGAYNEQNGYNANVYDGTPPQGGINKDSALYMLKRYEGHWINMTSADMLT